MEGREREIEIVSRFKGKKKKSYIKDILREPFKGEWDKDSLLVRLLSPVGFSFALSFERYRSRLVLYSPFLHLLLG